MKKFFHKNGVWFAVAFIVIYVVGSGLADQLSQSIHMEKALTVIFQLALALVLAEAGAFALGIIASAAVMGILSGLRRK